MMKVDHAHSKLIAFIWNLSNDCLRDVYVRGKYREVILPMVVLRRLDTLLEPTKEQVLEEVTYQTTTLNATSLDGKALKAASGYLFYNTSPWTLTSLFKAANHNSDILLNHLEEYLHGFSDNVKEIITCFDLSKAICHMATKHVLLEVIEKFIPPHINFSPESLEDPDGNTRRYVRCLYAIAWGMQQYYMHKKNTSHEPT